MHKYDKISATLWWCLTLCESQSLFHLIAIAQNSSPNKDGKQYLDMFQRQAAQCPQETQHSASH